MEINYNHRKKLFLIPFGRGTCNIRTPYFYKDQKYLSLFISLFYFHRAINNGKLCVLEIRLLGFGVCWHI